MKRIYLLLLTALLLSSCTKGPIKWDNTMLHLFPDDQSSLFIKRGNGHFYESTNGDEFKVEFEEYMEGEQPMFRLAVFSKNKDFHYIVFDGFDGRLKNGEIDVNKEPNLDWKVPNRSVVMTGKLIPLEETPYNFYELFLSRDKKK